MFAHHRQSWLSALVAMNHGPHHLGGGTISVDRHLRAADDVKRFGRWLREIQTGRVQNYLLLVLVSVVLLAALYITLFS